MSIKIAIIGSGPSAFYTVQNLLKSQIDCEIDIIERIFSPYGLIRYGVAPDHQSTKNVIRVFERALKDERVEYFGNVEVDTEPSIDQLVEIYDAVVIATGMSKDRKLNINELNKSGYFGATEFVNWYNGHPNYNDLDPNLNTDTAIIIGNGNVAIDCARLLVKNENELSKSDIAPYAKESLLNSNIKKVYIVGRRGPLDAKFTTVEIREMGELLDCNSVLSDGTIDYIDKILLNDDLSKQYKILTSFPELKDLKDNKNKIVEFKFHSSPVTILGDSKITGVKFKNNLDRNKSSTDYIINCGLVISAIGYEGEKISNIKTDNTGMIIHKDNIIQTGLYTVGWISRGPTGVIGTNKHDGAKVAQHIINDIKDTNKPGRKELKNLLNNFPQKLINKESWFKLNEEEINRSNGDNPREKFTSHNEVINFLYKNAN